MTVSDFLLCIIELLRFGPELLENCSSFSATYRSKKPGEFRLLFERNPPFQETATKHFIWMFYTCSCSSSVPCFNILSLIKEKLSTGTLLETEGFIIAFLSFVFVWFSSWLNAWGFVTPNWKSRALYYHEWPIRWHVVWTAHIEASLSY